MLWKEMLSSCRAWEQEKKEAVERSERKSKGYPQVIHNRGSFRGCNLIFPETDVKKKIAESEKISLRRVLELD